MECDQAPGSRFFWVERAFCDLEWHGPERAAGVIIWNHGISGTLPEWRAPAPLAFRLLQARGWDVLMVKRNNLAEKDVYTSEYRTVERTLEEIKTQRSRGYRKAVLAGQSFGGHVTLATAQNASDVFAVIAMAPGVRLRDASGRLDETVVERMLQRARTERIAVVFPKNDAMFNFIVRGPGANKVLAARGIPYLMFDETSGLTGHGGGTRGRFAFDYGACLVDFLMAPTLPSGRFTCAQAPDRWRVARELLLPTRTAARITVLSKAVVPEAQALIGRWYGLLGDTLVLFALVDGPGGTPRAMYRWASARPGGGVYDATVKDGRVTVALPNKASVAVVPGEAPALKWTSADGSAVLTTTLTQAPED